MKKRILLPLVLAASGLLAACGGADDPADTESHPDSSDLVTSSSDDSPISSSSEEPLLPTAALTDEMLSGLRSGYHATVRKATLYDGEEGDPYYYDAKVKEGMAYLHFYSDYEAGAFSSYYDFLITPVTEEDGLTYAYSSGLGINNAIIHEPIEVTDPITREDVNLLWEDAYLENPFKDLSANAFAKVNDNEFSLDLDMEAVTEKDVALKLANQLFFDSYPYSTSLPDVYSFSLKTNGNEIVGFSLEFESYSSSSGNVVIYRSTGVFHDVGTAPEITELTPLEGAEDADFQAAMTKLKTMNFKFDQVQYSYDYTGSGTFVKSLHYDGFADGTSLVYNAYDLSSDLKIYAEALTPITYEGISGLGVYVPLGDYYYSDSIFYSAYTDIASYFSKFDLSSKYFTKEAKDGATVFTLDRSRRIFRGNDISMISPFDSDQYADLLVNLTVTVKEDSIVFENQTSDDDESGLRFKISFSDFGAYSNLITDATIKEDCSDLKWSEILSNNQSALKAVTKIYTQENLDAIPTLGGIYANVRIDASSANAPILYTYTYSEETNAELLESYSQKLVDGGFAKESAGDDEEDGYYYTKQVTIGSRNYLLTVTPGTFWNSIQSWGQFQIALSLGSVK